MCIYNILVTPSFHQQTGKGRLILEKVKMHPNSSKTTSTRIERQIKMFLYKH